MLKVRTDRRSRSSENPSSAVRASLVRFTLLSGIALAGLGVAVVLVGRSTAQDLALDDARDRTVRIADALAAPLMNRAVLRHDPQAIEALSDTMKLLIAGGSIRHIKIWSPDEEVIWSDETALIGRRFALSDEITALFGTEDAVAQPTELNDPDNIEEPETSLLEVYVGAADPDGRPFVFEAYFSRDRIAQNTRGFFDAFVPVGLLGLILFQLVALSLALLLARQVDRSRQYCSDILDRSMSAWHEERRRLAHELHDGVVQELSAAGYALSAVRSSLPEGPSADRTRTAVAQVGQMLEQGLTDLRVLVTDQFPGDVREVLLPEALQTLVRRTADKGLPVRLELVRADGLDTRTAGLVYRIVREGLRNVEKHAHARLATVRVCLEEHDGSRVTVQVEDDGRGVADVAAVNGHVGLRLLASLMTDVGGILEVRSAVPSGTVLEARFPSSLGR